MEFQGVDLSMLVKLFFVFEGAILWKGVTVTDEVLTQNIEYDVLCKEFMHNKACFKSRLTLLGEN